MAVADLGPTQLKNIERPIRVYSLQVGVPAQAKPLMPAKPPEPRSHLRLALAAAGIAALIAIGTGAWHFLSAKQSAWVAAPSVAILPFDNLGGDEQASRLADGMTEDVITDLARYKDLLVIARKLDPGLQGQARRRAAGREGPQCPLCAGGLHTTSGRPASGDSGAHRCRYRRSGVVRALGPARSGSVRRAGRGRR
jgi:hypothetical protein